MKKSFLILSLCLLAAAGGCMYHGLKTDHELRQDLYLAADSAALNLSTREIETIVGAILAGYDAKKYYPEADILNPYNETLFPRDFAAPVFRWEDRYLHSDQWLITIRFARNNHSIHVLTDQTSWTPTRDIWEIIKADSLEQKAFVTILGVDTERARNIITKTVIAVSTSRDEVGAPLMYVQMPLPFEWGREHPEEFLWRFGAVSSYDPPPVVLKNLPFCGNCHYFSRDGRMFGMDIDYRGDKGGYAISAVDRRMILKPEDIITWNDFNKEDEQKSQGFFAKISPDGRYIIGTVKERSFFALLADIDFSQFFFPARGLLACYCITDRTFFSLPGADDPNYIQTCPAWSPDGRYIVFSRAKVDPYLIETLGDKNYIEVDQNVTIHDLNKKYRIMYDLYRIPFNEGRGGTPEPLSGAGGNGKSNYFPSFSPDGRWIVFTQSDTGLAIQPGSKLYIIPAEGGTARQLECNTSMMNSWHSWSPNNRWLVFSSKVNTPYTELFITHIDQNGTASVPVLLSRFSGDKQACVAPEFVDLEPDAIQEILLSDE